MIPTPSGESAINASPSLFVTMVWIGEDEFAVGAMGDFLTFIEDGIMTVGNHLDVGLGIKLGFLFNWFVIIWGGKGWIGVPSDDFITKWGGKGGEIRGTEFDDVLDVGQFVAKIEFDFDDVGFFFGDVFDGVDLVGFDLGFAG